jgi:phage I-like protein
MEIKEPLVTGQEITIEIMPLEGEYKATTIDGTDFLEKFSVESANKIVDNWKKDGEKPILCDVDHSSVETSKTQAAGWVTNLWVDEFAKRLMGTLQVSESGAELLNGLEYRYVSPVLLFTEDNFPYYLDSIALTNTPRLQELRPVYNSKDNDDAEKATVENEPEEKPEETNVNIDEQKDFALMEELKKILGLPEEATEEDIRASVAELVEKVKAVAEEEAKAEAERLQEEAEEAVNECGQFEDEKKEEVVNCYKKDPALVKTILNCFAKKTPSKTVVNAQEAVKPELTDAQKLKAEFDKLPGGQAKVDFMLAHRGKINL